MKNEIIKENLVGEVTLGYSRKKKISLKKITCPQDSEKFIREIFPLELINHREYAYVIFLDRSNKILGYFMISSGGVSGTIMDPKIIFQSALLANASGIILFHNHPSGNLNPSNADINITEKIKLGSSILDFILLDHIIITEDSFYSFSQEGKL